VDETTPDRRTLNEIPPQIAPISTPKIEPQSTPLTSTTIANPVDPVDPSDGTSNLSWRRGFHHVIHDTVQSDIRDDILVEDLTPHPTDPIDVPQPPDRTLEQAIALLDHYSFEIEGSSARRFASDWADDLPSEWLRLAILEALYQGRYKAVSVSQILALWERKQQPQIHFNEEFERLICDRLFAEVEAQTLDDAIEINPKLNPESNTETPDYSADQSTDDCAPSREANLTIAPAIHPETDP